MMDHRIKNLIDNQVLWLCLILVLVSAIFHSVIHFEFLGWDDFGYIVDDQLIRDLSFKGIRNIFFTSQVGGSYSPMVLLSWAIDYRFFGLDSGAFHTVNLILHLINCGLVFMLVKAWTRNQWIGLFVTLMFGVNPMHVEPVAWATARKDLLLALFSLLAFISFHRLKKSGNHKWWFAIYFFFLLALLSKAVAVVIPVILVFANILLYRGSISISVFIQKAPMFLLSLLFGLLAIKAQSDAGAFSSDVVSFCDDPRLVLSSISEILFLAIVPFKTSPLHPFPSTQSLSTAWYSISTLVAVLFLIGLPLVLRKQKTLLFAWLFFLVWIMPTLQFKPFGMAHFAERFTYLSYVGLFVLMGGGLNIFFQTSRNAFVRNSVLIGIVLATLVYSSLTYRYLGAWKNNKTLWSWVSRTYPNSHFAPFKLGMLAAKEGNNDEALMYFNRTIQLNSSYPEGYSNRGMVHLLNRNNEAARSDFETAIGLDSSYGMAWVNNGAALLNLGRNQESIKASTRALELGAEIRLAHYNIAVAQENMGQFEKAASSFESALINGNTNAYYGAARNYAVASDLENSKRIIQAGLMVDANDVMLLTLRSEVAFREKDYSVALKYAELSIANGAVISKPYMSEIQANLNSE